LAYLSFDSDLVNDSVDSKFKMENSRDVDVGVASGRGLCLDALGINFRVFVSSCLQRSAASTHAMSALCNVCTQLKPQQTGASKHASSQLPKAFPRNTRVPRTARKLIK
jgi:hypothetical protein